MAKQGENIYLRKDGRWEGRYIKGYKSGRSPLYGYVYGKDYNTASEKLETVKEKYRRPENAVGFAGMFADYCVRWLETTARENEIKPSTYGSYFRDIHNHIIPDFGPDTLPHLLGKSDVDHFRDKLRGKGLADGTIVRIMRLLFMILGAAHKDGVILANLGRKMRMPHRRKRPIVVLSVVEQVSLEQVCEQEKTGLLVLLALYTGMRIGEISALQWADVDFEAGFLYVRETAQRLTKYNGFYDDGDNDDDGAKTKLFLGLPKSDKSERDIALSPNTISYLEKAKSEADCKYVISCKGHIAEPRVLQYRFDTLLKKAGIKKISFHSCRHTFATRCQEGGVDLKTLSDLMGHAGDKITLQYGKISPEHKKEAVAVLDSICTVAV